MTAVITDQLCFTNNKRLRSTLNEPTFCHL